MRQIAIFIFAYTAAAVTYILAPSLFTQRDDSHEQNRTKEKIVAQTEYEISESIVKYETVSDRQEALEIETYPNPSANAFNVVFPEDASDGTYQLTTTTGTILDEGKTPQRSMLIDLSTEPSDYYILKVRIGENMYYEELQKI